LRRPVESTQYVSLAFGQAAGKAGIARSMGSRGDCFDNAVAESFFATLKKELVHRRPWPTRRELTSELFEYIEAFYNPIRRHSTLGMLSPIDFEEQSISPTPNTQASPESANPSEEAGELQAEHRLVGPLGGTAHCVAVALPRQIRPVCWPTTPQIRVCPRQMLTGLG